MATTQVTPTIAANVLAALKLGTPAEMAERMWFEVLRGWYELPFQYVEMMDMLPVLRKLAAYDEAKRAQSIVRLEAHAATR